MAFAVDGGITVPGKFGARVGDTILVTEDGAECVTESPRDQPVL
jgi:Xaa-Pro aminopeptidase